MSEREIMDEAALLREAFDHGFALPSAGGLQATEDLLTIRLADAPHALRAREVYALHRDRKVVPIPSAAPALHGIIGLHGEVLPVYGLAELLGHEGSVGPTPWLAVCGAPDRVCLAFSALDGFVRVALDRIYAAEGGAQRTLVQHLFRAGERVHPIVDVGAVVETIKQRCGTRRALGER